jgi:MFS family permease
VLEALRVRDLRLLWFARLISLLGSWLLVVAVPAQVYRLTGSLALTGLTLAAEMVPPQLLGPVAGMLADRWDRRHLMVAADLLRAVAVATLVPARDPADVWLVYLPLVAESIGTVLFRPAAQAHTPVVVGTGPMLTSANTLNALVDGAVRLLGPPLGGALLAVAGFELLIWLDTATYLVSAAAILFTARVAGPPLRSGGWGDLRAGLAFVRADRVVRPLLWSTPCSWVRTPRSAPCSCRTA